MSTTRILQHSIQPNHSRARSARHFLWNREQNVKTNQFKKKSEGLTTPTFPEKTLLTKTFSLYLIQSDDN